ncbi:hypothetical protein MTO96_009876 [Rhipicephalus appendiculatus]
MCAAETLSVDTRERAIREPGIGSSARQITPEEQLLSAGEAAAIRPATFCCHARRGAALEKCADQEASWRGCSIRRQGGVAFVAFAYRVDVERAPADAATLFLGSGQAHLQTVMQTKQCVTAPRHREPFSRRPTFWLSSRAAVGPASVAPWEERDDTLSFG